MADSLADAAADRARGVAGNRGDLAARFARDYVDATEPEDLSLLTPDFVARVVASHLAVGATRAPHRPAVHVGNPTVARDGWESPHTVVDVVTDDTPFVVDSVVNAIVGDGRDVHLLVHPVDAGEAHVHAEIDRETDPDALAALEEELASALADVLVVVADWGAMHEAARARAAELRTDPPPSVDRDDALEAATFLDWLADDHFTFVGLIEYDLVATGEGDELMVVDGSRRGVLRRRDLGSRSRSFATWDTELRAHARDPFVLTLTKAQARSTVHRRVPLDYVGVKRFDAHGTVVGETRFTGLYTANVYSESTAAIPVLRRKTAQVIAQAGFAPDGHDARALVNILETYPRDELFRLPVAELSRIAIGILQMGERRRVRVFVSRDQFGRFASCLVFLPRDRYTTAVRLAVLDALRDAFGATDVDYTALVTESVLARLHVVVSAPDGVGEVDEAALERRLAALARFWVDDFADALVAARGEERGLDTLHAWADAFPAAYRDEVPAPEAVTDLAVLEGLGHDGDLAVGFAGRHDGAESVARLKVYRSGPPLELSSLMPILEHLGVTVVDERPYLVSVPGTGPCTISSFGVRAGVADALADPAAHDRIAELFVGVWDGAFEDDPLNRLVLDVGLPARDIVILRALYRYLRQVGYRFDDGYVATTLATHPDVTRGLVDLFHARFQPGIARDDAALAARRAELFTAIDRVESLDEDRILRALTALLGAVVRTNAYQCDAGGGRRPALAFKLEPSSLEFVIRPRPRHEIWVYSPRVEGVHLRAGDVARGGIRWSDRREDFRTEVLGLMKAQTVKNSVIVPVGAKGGFVAKRLAPWAERAETQAEVLACYRVFIGSLLDVTDNLVDGAVVPPADVVRYDGDDPYLVVAADRGTATFSDVANGMALERGFWLGDAFASGGSAGWDHKAMGITSRGAWISVRSHFRALGIDADTAPLTVVGIGDMSGDVFGNGMLRSPHLELVAAFDHRHIFLDPDPDPARAYAERVRMFALPASSWADYDPAAISAGGGVFPRTAKSIPLAPAVQAVLGVTAAALTPDELVSAILRAPVDLLWNGGIGTFVKASTERNADVGDRSNDAVRVDASTLRCKVVGEGGNLGFTQLARVEYALQGGRINTDAIDNSAGVDTSDHEVNVKILLRDAIEAGALDAAQREPLLAQMTDDVAELVLADNEAQANALAIAAVEAVDLAGVHARQMDRLEQTGRLDRALEGLPTTRALQERTAVGTGLTAPELAVLLAHSKLALESELVASDVPDDPALVTDLVRYFPRALHDLPERVFAEHRLRREIVSTVVANAVVNRGGISFLSRLSDETGASFAVLTRAHVVARDTLGVVPLWERIDGLDLAVDASVQYEMFLAVRRLVERSARWLVHHGGDLAIGPSVARYRPGVTAVVDRLPDLLVGTAAARLHDAVRSLTDRAVPTDMATAVARADAAQVAFWAVELGERLGVDPVVAAGVHFVLADRLGLDGVRDRIVALPRADRWQTEARAALRDDFQESQAALDAAVLEQTAADATPEARVVDWTEKHRAAVDRFRGVVDDIDTAGIFDLTTLAVARRALRELAEGAG